MVRKPAARRRGALAQVLANWSVRIGGTILLLLIAMAICAPWLNTIDPQGVDPTNLNLPPFTFAEFNSLDGSSFEHFFIFGSDGFGRDIWSRTLYGARISLAVGACAALIAVVIGMSIGLIGGYVRAIDGVLMRVMDGLMAIPSILFAISLVATFGGSLSTVIVAIAIPEIPRVARIVRSAVLTIREEAYVEAAIALDTPPWKILLRHILPNAMAPLIVQATYVCAAAILVEAILSFLGVGLPAEIPTWGNVLATGRAQFNQFPSAVLLPAVFLGLTVLSVNIVGDGLRDTLDPKFKKRGS
nr:MULTISPECIES: ABC transporter permease [unclassified Achromobacter]